MKPLFSLELGVADMLYRKSYALKEEKIIKLDWIETGNTRGERC